MKWIKISENPKTKGIKRFIISGRYPDGKKFIGAELWLGDQWDSANYNPKWFTHYSELESLSFPDDD